MKGSGLCTSGMSWGIVASHANDLRGTSRAGTCDEPPRMSTWEARDIEMDVRLILGIKT